MHSNRWIKILPMIPKTNLDMEFFFFFVPGIMPPTDCILVSISSWTQSKQSDTAPIACQQRLIACKSFSQPAKHFPHVIPVTCQIRGCTTSESAPMETQTETRGTLFHQDSTRLRKYPIQTPIGQSCHALRLNSTLSVSDYKHHLHTLTYRLIQTL